MTKSADHLNLNFVYFSTIITYKSVILYNLYLLPATDRARKYNWRLIIYRGWRLSICVFVCHIYLRNGLTDHNAVFFAIVLFDFKEGF